MATGGFLFCCHVLDCPMTTAKRVQTQKKAAQSKIKLRSKKAKTVATKAKLSKAVKNHPKVIKAKPTLKKVTKMDALDQLLLKMTAKPYNKFLKQIKIGKKKLSDERKLALQLGTRILEKAKEVRDSLMVSTTKTRNK